MQAYFFITESGQDCFPRPPLAQTLRLEPKFEEAIDATANNPMQEENVEAEVPTKLEVLGKTSLSKFIHINKINFHIFISNVT